MIPYQRRSGKNQRCPVSVTMGSHLQAEEQAELGPGAQRVVDRPPEGCLVHREERRCHQEQRDHRRGAQEDQRDRLPLDAGATELEVLVHPFVDAASFRLQLRLVVPGGPLFLLPWLCGIVGVLVWLVGIRTAVLACCGAGVGYRGYAAPSW